MLPPALLASRHPALTLAHPQNRHLLRPTNNTPLFSLRQRRYSLTFREISLKHLLDDNQAFTKKPNCWIVLGSSASLNLK